MSKSPNYTLHDGTNLEVTVAAPALLEAINQVSSVAGDVLLLTADGEESLIVGYGKNGTTLARPLKLEAKGKGTLPLEKAVIVPMLNRRKTDITFRYNGTELKFKAKTGKFSGSLKCSPLLDEEAQGIRQSLSERPSDSTVLTEKAAQTLWSTVDLASITDPLFGEVLTRFITVNEEGMLSVSSFDNIHMSLVESRMPEGFGQMQVALTDQYINTLRKVHGTAKVRISMKDNAFIAISDQGFLSMPPLQADEGAWDTVKQFVAEREKPRLRVKLRPKRLAMVLENLCSIYESGASVECETGPDSLRFSIQTSYGKLTDQMPCEELKGEASFSIEPFGLQDLVRLLPEKELITWEVIPKQQYRFISEALGATYLGSLHE